MNDKLEKKCERCGNVPVNFDYLDYCFECSKDLCFACMQKGCCKKIPATSGLAEDERVRQENQEK